MMKPIEPKQLLKKIDKQMGLKHQAVGRIGEDQAYKISSEHLVEITGILIDDFDCAHLSAITAQQRESQLDTIEVMYHFWRGAGITFLITLPADSPKLPSIKARLPGADFYEREAAEMFGITFTGREETPPLLLPDEWSEGPPFIRKETQDE